MNDLLHVDKEMGMPQLSPQSQRLASVPAESKMVTQEVERLLYQDRTSRKRNYEHRQEQSEWDQPGAGTGWRKSSPRERLRDRQDEEEENCR